jgi:hypothetical protein
MRRAAVQAGREEEPEGAASGLRGSSDTRLRGRWLVAARLLWLCVAVASIGIGLFGIPFGFDQAQRLCPDSGPCPFPQLTPEQARALHPLGISLAQYAAFNVAIIGLDALVYVVLALMIFWRKSDDRRGLFVSITFLTFGVVNASPLVQTTAALSPAWILLVTALAYVGQVCFGLFVYLFPDGRFVPRWIWWLGLLWAFLNVPVYFLPGSALDYTSWNPALHNGIFGAFVLSMMGAQVYRYWRISSPRQRQQTKWFVYGATIGAAGLLATTTISSALPPRLQEPTWYGYFVILLLIYLFEALIPLSVGIAILRSRLWDIDVIIKRTLVYGSLTATLAALYFGVVIGLQSLATALTHQTTPQPIVIVASTLLIAALFDPLRRRVQAVIDRRFYRSRYDAARTMEAFATSLRTELDLADLSEHLLSVVQETMQPAHISLWLRQPAPAAEARQERPHNMRQISGPPVSVPE